jgi:hypothetical protein
MPVGIDKCTNKSKGRPPSVMAQLIRSVVELKTEDNCLAHAIILAIANPDKDPNYESYRHGYNVRSVVRNLLDTTGIDLDGGGGSPN